MVESSATSVSDCKREDFWSSAPRSMARCSTCHTRLSQAADLYKGDFLEGFFLEDSQAFDEWLVLKREGLRRQAVEVFSRLATYYETRGEYAPALQHSYRLLELEPWREEAHRQTMRLLALTGQRNSALAQYEAVLAHLPEAMRPVVT